MGVVQHLQKFHVPFDAEGFIAAHKGCPDDPELLRELWKLVKPAVFWREEPIQMTMLTKDSEVINRLKAIDVNTLTPIESMNILFELANMLKDSDMPVLPDSQPQYFGNCVDRSFDRCSFKHAVCSYVCHAI